MVDIHNYDKQYENWERYVRESSISERNKELIFEYRNACLLRGVCGKVRLIRAFQILLRTAVLLDKDFDTVARKDLEELITTLQRSKRKPATIATYGAIIKRFFAFVLRPDDFHTVRDLPPEIAWIPGRVKKKDEPRLLRSQLLTADDVQDLLRVARHPRDKAFISILWETGCRISEIGNLQLKHISHHEHGLILDVTGKGGTRRSPLIVSSSPHLAAWLAVHPFREDLESPLWVHHEHRDAPRAIRYDTIRTMIKQHCLRARITKRVWQHLFRHSRNTHVLAAGIMTEAQAKQYFGWTPSSTMLSRYSHLTDFDAHSALLRENNLVPATKNEPPLQSQTCARCRSLNSADASHCTRCALPMNPAVAYNAPDTARLALELVKVLADKGLLDTAADQINRANLGPTLAKLANSAHAP